MMRKAQGAIEYLFMIAAALVIILIVVRQLRGKGSSASTTANTAESSIGSELNSMMSSS
ncbi:class III signal peptide-containing protein [Thermococcus henrietii]|uniref:class III signal peptide-containing protein n=1 Tax=Thermococcus henrietii TaxID=2016361 RepID=UPI000C0814EF|nr:class III signal peptide-containing protein [Thermococcus henrietii]